MKENISKNIIFTLIITIFSTILSLIINKILLDIVGQEELGLFRILTQIVFYLALLDLGISTSATVALYKPLIAGDRKNVSIIYNTIKMFYNKVSIFCFIIGGATLPILIYFIQYDSYANLSIYWLLFVINTCFTFLTNKYIILYLADQKVFYVKAVTGIALLFEKSIQLFLLLYLESFILFLAVSIFITIIKYFILNKRLTRFYDIDKNEEEVDKSVKTDAGLMFFHKLSHIVLYNTDNILIAKFTSLATVASYSSYIMLTTLIMTVVSIFHSVVDPVVGKIVSYNDNTKNQKLWSILFSFSFWIVGYIALGFYIFASGFINIWLGPELTLSKFIVLLVSINLFFDIIKWPTELLKYKHAYYKDVYNPILEVIINLIVSLLLGYKYGVPGVIFGTIVVNILSNLIIKPYIVFEICLKVSVFLYIRKLCLSTLELLLIVSAVMFFVNDYDFFDIYTHDNWTDFALDFFLYSILYFLIWSICVVCSSSRSVLKDFIIFVKYK